MSKEFFLKTRECLTRANYTSPKIKDLYIKCKSLGDGLCEDNVFEFFSELCDEVETLYVSEQEDSSEKDNIDDLKYEIECLEKDLEYAVEEIDSLRDDIDDLDSKLSDAESRISELELEISSLKEENENLKSNTD